MKIATEFCIKCSNEDANKAYSKVYDGFTATSTKEAHRKGFVEGYNYLADRVAELDERITTEDLLPCPFCGTTPKRYVSNDILHVNCPTCVTVGFHNHVRFGCRADDEWNNRTTRR